MSYEIVPPDPKRPDPQVGSFAQGSEASQWLLRRYLLSQAIGASIVRTVHWAAIAVLVLAVALWFGGLKVLAVLFGLVAAVILLIRMLLSGLQRRLSGLEAMGPAGMQVERLVGRTRRGLRAELRRIGLPSAPWGPALIGLRLLRSRRRADTLARLRSFDLGQVVDTSTLDELHVLLRRHTLS
ncbi:hypothetical protein M6D93_12785 [Jatrophihabitans telluris]|uniref:Uncharacterized protein n=1 Tax=Jatrophihabitans telluris TaxID=2038343 RepID=A0ABY4QW34_9ACTN|nr:hypothetical protein [Jatrophihabitans telluris]UQX87174.1 hypothetical protein M6D93_12785 [Jatrophihabitans telluris]